jgi:hypothetical protein
MDAQAAIIDGPAASVRAPLDPASRAQGAG